MFKLLLLAGLAAGGFFAYKRFAQRRDEDDWDDDTMYGSAQLHQTVDTPAPDATT